MDPRGEDEDPDDDKKDKAEDESEEDDDKAKKPAKDKGAKDKEACDEDDGAEDEDDDDKEEKVSKSAMDAAIRSATTDAVERVRQQARDLRTAEQEVRPYVGEIAVACDSAEDVYRHALKALKVDIAGVPAVALRPLLKALPVPKASAPTLPAMDAAAEDAYSKRFPNAGRLK
jgi:hypothetical protein